MNVSVLKDDIKRLESQEAQLAAQERELDKACDRLLATSPAKLHEPLEFTDSGRPITPASNLAGCRERLTLVRERLRVLRASLPTPADDEAGRAELAELADRLASLCASFASEEEALGPALGKALRAMVASARLRREAWVLDARLRERCNELGLARPTAPGVAAFRAVTITLAGVLRRATQFVVDETRQVHPVDEQLARSVAAALGEQERARVPEVAAP